MRRFVRFAVISLSAFAAYGADLRPMSDPKLVAKVFPAEAKVRLVNFWATWCVPCVEEMPQLRAVDETFGAELAVVGVSIDDMLPGTKREKVAAFLDKQRIAWPNIYYTGTPDALGAHFDFDGAVPLTVLYDAKGKELWRKQGAIEKDETIARVRELLRRKR